MVVGVVEFIVEVLKSGDNEVRENVVVVFFSLLLKG